MKKWTSKQIKALRDKCKISQRTLGNLTGETSNYVYLLEKGEKEPSKTLSLLLDCVEEKLKKKEVKKNGKRNL